MFARFAMVPFAEFCSGQLRFGEVRRGSLWFLEVLQSSVKSAEDLGGSLRFAHVFFAEIRSSSPHFVEDSRAFVNVRQGQVFGVSDGGSKCQKGSLRFSNIRTGSLNVLKGSLTFSKLFFKFHHDGKGPQTTDFGGLKSGTLGVYRARATDVGSETALNWMSRAWRSGVGWLRVWSLGLQGSSGHRFRIWGSRVWR